MSRLYTWMIFAVGIFLSQVYDVNFKGKVPNIDWIDPYFYGAVALYVHWIASLGIAKEQKDV